MDFEHYMRKTRETAVYPKNYERDYVIHGLTDELGELLETVKENSPGGKETVSYPVTGQKHTEDICKEMGDCTWYLARLCDHFGFSFDRLNITITSDERRTYSRGEELVQESLLQAARINGYQKKSVRDNADKQKAIKQAAQGVFSNLQKAAHHLGLYNLDVVLERNLNKLFDRKDRGKLHGDGDDR